MGLHKTLYEKHFNAPLAWRTDGIRVYLYVALVVHFTFKDGLWWSVRVPNKVFSDVNPVRAFCKALESETLGMAKYTLIKDCLRSKGMWSKL